ncbi:MAG: hypothetical protein NT065_02365 [Chlamydiae bacterium]|nr:hypothetical protein [Chlamydiota bacterium]
MRRWSFFVIRPFFIGLFLLVVIQNLYAAGVLDSLDHSEKIAPVTFSRNEIYLIDHVRNSIIQAEQGISKLPPVILDIQGMSSVKMRHLLNNLCSMPDTRYLEIGCWRGSTFIASLFGNQGSLSSAVGIDNWSESNGPYRIFKKNCSLFLKDVPYDFYAEDCFNLNLSNAFSKPINIYFYDGNHNVISQEMAFTYYNEILNNTFIAVINEWNVKDVEIGTRTAFNKLNYQVLYEIVLPVSSNADKKNWWNGLYIAVVRK